MRLTEHERERLLITLAADVAERRRGRGLKLNHPEAVAILTSFVLAGAGRGAPPLGRHGRGSPPRRPAGHRASSAADCRAFFVRSFRRRIWLPRSRDARGPAPHHALVLGAGVALAGGDEELAARATALGTCAGPASAAVRLLGLDPFAVQAMLARLAPEVDECAAAAARTADQ